MFRTKIWLLLVTNATLLQSPDKANNLTALNEIVIFVKLTGILLIITIESLPSLSIVLPDNP